MKKELYMVPEVELVLFQENDVIRTSGLGDVDNNYGDEVED